MNRFYAIKKVDTELYFGGFGPTGKLIWSMSPLMFTNAALVAEAEQDIQNVNPDPLNSVPLVCVPLYELTADEVAFIESRTVKDVIERLPRSNIVQQIRQDIGNIAIACHPDNRDGLELATQVHLLALSMLDFVSLP